MVDFFLLLMLGGAGDELQGIKRGIMEAADLIALTKGDTDTDNKGRAAVNDLRNAIALLPPRSSGRQPEVLVTSAITGQGITGLCDRLEQLFAEDTGSGHIRHRRQEQDLHWLRRSMQDGLMRALQNDHGVQSAWARLEMDVREGRRSPSSAAEELITLFRTGGAPLP